MFNAKKLLPSLLAVAVLVWLLNYPPAEPERVTAVPVLPTPEPTGDWMDAAVPEAPDPLLSRAAEDAPRAANKETPPANPKSRTQAGGGPGTPWEAAEFTFHEDGSWTINSPFEGLARQELVELAEFNVSAAMLLGINHMTEAKTDAEWLHGRSYVMRSVALAPDEHRQEVFEVATEYLTPKRLEVPDDWDGSYELPDARTDNELLHYIQWVRMADDLGFSRFTDLDEIVAELAARGLAEPDHRPLMEALQAEAVSRTGRPLVPRRRKP